MVRGRWRWLNFVYTILILLQGDGVRGILEISQEEKGPLIIDTKTWSEWLSVDWSNPPNDYFLARARCAGLRSLVLSDESHPTLVLMAMLAVELHYVNDAHNRTIASVDVRERIAFPCSVNGSRRGPCKLESEGLVFTAEAEAEPNYENNQPHYFLCESDITLREGAPKVLSQLLGYLKTRSRAHANSKILRYPSNPFHVEWFVALVLVSAFCVVIFSSLAATIQNRLDFVKKKHTSNNLRLVRTIMLAHFALYGFVIFMNHAFLNFRDNCFMTGWKESAVVGICQGSEREFFNSSAMILPRILSTYALVSVPFWLMNYFMASTFPFVSRAKDPFHSRHFRIVLCILLFIVVCGYTSLAVFMDAEAGHFLRITGFLGFPETKELALFRLVLVTLPSVVSLVLCILGILFERFLPEVPISNIWEPRCPVLDRIDGVSDSKERRYTEQLGSLIPMPYEYSIPALPMLLIEPVKALVLLMGIEGSIKDFWVTVLQVLFGCTWDVLRSF